MQVQGQQGNIAFARLLPLVALVAISVIGGYFLQPLIGKNKDAVNAVITIFSILAGFLIAVITFMVDPAIKSAKSWQDLQSRKKAIHRKLLRYRLIFYCYLTVLALALATHFVPASCVIIKANLEWTFVSLALIVFGISFTLPKSLTDLQMSKLKEAINEQAPEEIKKINAKK